MAWHKQTGNSLRIALRPKRVSMTLTVMTTLSIRVADLTCLAFYTAEIGATMDGEFPGGKGFLKFVDYGGAVIDPIEPTAIGTTYLIIIRVCKIDF